jgi:hypothetical protein
LTGRGTKQLCEKLLTRYKYNALSFFFKKSVVSVVLCKLVHAFECLFLRNAAYVLFLLPCYFLHDSSNNTDCSLFLWPQQIIESCTAGEKLMTSHEYLDVKRKDKVHTIFLSYLRFILTDPALLALHSSLVNGGHNSVCFCCFLLLPGALGF